MPEYGTTARLMNRRALEALRNGVPNGDAIVVLGCNQPAVQRDFDAMLSNALDVGDGPYARQAMLVAGGFGTGKSHLLGYLESHALAQNFVCSRVVISKETPLFNMDKVFKAAVENARAPGITGHMVEEVALKLDYNSEGYAKFFEWANAPASGLHGIIPASLMVYERDDDLELLNDITSFWSGEKSSGVSKIVRDGLKHINQVQSYHFRAPTLRELQPQRLRFVLELIKAAGYHGWVILMDEIELVASYSILQRARSYAELVRWMGQAEDESYPGLKVVGTMSDDFASFVLDQKEDRDKAAPRLRARQREDDNIAATRAEIGMRLIERGVRPLEEPDDQTLLALYERLRAIHSEAYGWDAPEIDHGIGLGGRSRRIRSFVRRWINEWDLRRLYPESEPDIEETELHFRYEEDRDLEKEIRENATDEAEPGYEITRG